MRTSYGLEAIEAAEDIEKDTLVYLDGDDKLAATTGSDVVPLGVLDAAVSAGDDASARRGTRVSYVVASEAISVGDDLMPAADGKVAVDAGTSNDVRFAIACTSASSGEKLAIEFTSPEVVS